MNPMRSKIKPVPLSRMLYYVFALAGLYLLVKCIQVWRASSGASLRKPIDVGKYSDL